MCNRWGRKMWVLGLFVLTAFFANSVPVRAENASGPLVLLTGPAGGIYEKIGNEIQDAAVMAGLAVEVRRSEGSVSSIQALARGEADLAIMQNDIAHQAANGLLAFDVPVKGISGLTSLYDEAAHLLVRAGLYLRSVADLRGKRVSLGLRGSGSSVNGRTILEAAGVTLEEVQLFYLPLDEASRAFRRGMLDALFVTSGFPSEAVETLTANGIAEVQGLDTEVMQRVVTDHPFLDVVPIPRDTYTGQTKEAQTISPKAILVARSDMDRDAVYRLLGALEARIANKTGLSAVAARLKLGEEGLSIGLHPGAADYYLSNRYQRKSFYLDAAKYVAWTLILVLALVTVRRRRRVIRFIRNRELGRIGVFVAFLLLVGSAVLYLVEQDVNSNFSTYPRSIWSVMLYLASGLENHEPVTTYGQVATTVILTMGAALVALLTGTVASILVKQHLLARTKRRRMKNHYVIVNWNEKGTSIIEQLHSEDLEGQYPIVIVTGSKDKIQFPEEPREVFGEVSFVLGDPTNERTLKEADIIAARSVIILSDESVSDHGDGRTILAVMAIRKVCKDAGTKQVPISAEIRDPGRIEMASHVGREHGGSIEIVSSAHLGMKLLAQSAVTPNITAVYDSLLTYRKEGNEIYKVKIPEALGLRTFDELLALALRVRTNGICFIPIGIARGNDVLLNDNASRAGSLEPGDEAFIVSDKPVRLDTLINESNVEKVHVG